MIRRRRQAGSARARGRDEDRVRGSVGDGDVAGLRGDAIPLMGRIICLADSFDAMTSNRTYRKALPLEVALVEIRRCAGTHFDPELAEAFLRTNPDQYRDLLNDHQEKSKRLLDLHEEPHVAPV